MGRTMVFNVKEANRLGKHYMWEIIPCYVRTVIPKWNLEVHTILRGPKYGRHDHSMVSSCTKLAYRQARFRGQESLFLLLGASSTPAARAPLLSRTRCHHHCCCCCWCCFGSLPRWQRRREPPPPAHLSRESGRPHKREAAPPALRVRDDAEQKKYVGA